jgi:Calcium binding
LLTALNDGSSLAAEVDVKRAKSTRPKKDDEREERILMQIVVDASNADERAVGWYSYLEDALGFPFTASCTQKRQISPLQVGDEVDVIDMADSTECRHEMFVMIQWEGGGLAVPLSQLKPSGHTDKGTQEAVEDWLYWVKIGYEF